ncbi:MAG TPA: DNA polymerase III subunit gamma/tau [Candidatus Saccharibacteria bacterium]|nr:DNA polymerase III subunit gamma/tau [Candidatus Saccharibacteria bacterium]HRK94238.1 DNA polymerase III subunit gamma/tau [Candidatus Saccharibacteria bacterium]
MSLALYRKYRSRSLDEIVGQSHVTDLLSRAIKQGRVAHAYLFTGPRGVGKTSIARILAHEINDLPYKDDSTHLDIIEIDAASNNGVDDIRDLRERVQIAPVSASKKVYIIDEVHMLSKPAFNALLKTLEEPPEHVVFILATTDVEKVPETILSRTQRHSFRRATEKDMVTNLKRIAKKEKIAVDEAALKLIASHSDGSFRDSVSLFDQLASSLGPDETLTAEHTQKMLGLAHDDQMAALVSAIDAGNLHGINQALNELEAGGTPVKTLTLQLINYLRMNMMKNPRYVSLINSLLDVSKSSAPELKLLTTLSLFNGSNARAAEPAVKAVIPTPAKEEKPEPTPAVSAPAPKKKTATPKGSTPFDWKTLLEHVRTHYVALHSVLSKCEPLLDGQTLTIYTKSAFYKKKLDDSKYRALLNGSLDELGMSGLEVETKPGAPPMKDSQAARVAAIMGGGEEVSVEDA